MPTTTTFNFTGGVQSIVVPSGVTSLTVDAWGGRGSGLGIGADGGLGGRVAGTIPVNPGETVWLYVGGSGAQGGWNGGGRCGGTSLYGGGATDIRRGGQGLANRVLVAAGGGSASSSGRPGGAGGGTTGTTGTSGDFGTGGTGGTQSAGGSNGGSAGVGGSSPADASSNFGGAGGGGLQGGGSAFNDANSGQAAGGGGGGSSLVPTGGSTTTGGALTDSGRLTLTYNQPPSSPPLYSPPNNTSINRNAPNILDWEHVDPDGDGQVEYQTRHRLVGAASWILNSTLTPNSFKEFPAGSFAEGQIEWQVRTRDAALWGPFSSSSFFTATTPPEGPPITSPVNGATVGAASVVLTWTAAGQDAYRVRSWMDVLGTRDGTVTYFDTGEVVSATTRSVTVPLPVNSRYEHLTIEVKDNGLWSPLTSVRILVSYTKPATALLSVKPVKTIDSPYDFTNAIAVTIVNPAPTGGQPSVSYRNVWCKALDDGDPYRPKDVPVRIATFVPQGVYLDEAPASGVRYAFAAEQIAVNGTASVSEYVATPLDLGTAGEGVFADAVFDPAVFD